MLGPIRQDSNLARDMHDWPVRPVVQETPKGIHGYTILEIIHHSTDPEILASWIHIDFLLFSSRFMGQASVCSC